MLSRKKGTTPSGSINSSNNNSTSNHHAEHDNGSDHSNNHKHDDDHDHKSAKRRAASPMSPRHKRSCMQCCRLRILRTRQYCTKRCIQWTFILTTLVYVFFVWIPQPWPLPGVTNSHGLTLYHKLAVRPTIQGLKTTSGQVLLKEAMYVPRPLMMGSVYMLLPEHLQQQLDQEQSRAPTPRKKGQLPRYELLEANIDYRDKSVSDTSTREHGRVIKKWLRKHQARIRRYDPQHHKAHHEFATQDLNWKFDAVFVRDMGNGLTVQREIRHNSKDYQRFQPDPYTAQCEPQYEWQTQSFPNCNVVHEQNLEVKMRQIGPHDEPEARLLASGGYRDVWYVEHTDLPDAIPSELLAMKTLLYKHPWSERNVDRHRRDALATDRLTRSPYALDIYAYCGNSGVYEFANGGSLQDLVDDDAPFGHVPFVQWNSAYKIHLALQVVRAVADIHNIDQEGRASMAHTDISMSQFVSTDKGKTFRINDFNRARFLYRDQNVRMLNCPFEVASNKGKFRSPEEYAYQGETEKVDVYSMGNIFYVLLTGKYPFEDVDKNEAKKLVKQGVRPEIPDDYWYSQDKYTQAMLEAIRRCWVQQAGMRTGARSVEVYLKNAVATEGKTVRVPKMEEMAKMKKERDALKQAQEQAKAKSDNDDDGAGGGGGGPEEAEMLQALEEERGGAAQQQQKQSAADGGGGGDAEVGGTQMTDANEEGGAAAQVQQQHNQEQPAVGDGEGDAEVGGTEMTKADEDGGAEQQQEQPAVGDGGGDAEVGGTEMTKANEGGGNAQEEKQQQQEPADGGGGGGNGGGDAEVGGTEMTDANEGN